MSKLDNILSNKNLSPETKVYLLSKELKDSGNINNQLWLAVLELKESNKDTVFSEIARLKNM